MKYNKPHIKNIPTMTMNAYASHGDTCNSGTAAVSCGFGGDPNALYGCAGGNGPIQCANGSSAKLSTASYACNSTGTNASGAGGTGAASCTTGSNPQP